MTSQILPPAASAVLSEALTASHLLAEAKMRLATAHASCTENLAETSRLWATAANFTGRGKATAAAAAARTSARNADKAQERMEAELAAAASAVGCLSAIVAAFEAQLGWSVPEVRGGEQWGPEPEATGQEEQTGMGIFVGTAEGGVSVLGGDVYGREEWAFPQPAPSAAVRACETFREQVRAAAASARSVSSSPLAYTGRDWPDAYTSSSCQSPISPSSPPAAVLRSVQEKRSTFKEMVWQAAEAAKPPPPPTCEGYEVADGDDYWTDDEIFIPNILPRRAKDGVHCRPTTWGPKKDGLVSRNAGG